MMTAILRKMTKKADRKVAPVEGSNRGKTAGISKAPTREESKVKVVI